ncbi:hypothetical protein KKF32_02820 [Patescibacteria group bacterium]|nr:hypothetical protein [Patescibacteria group bacterium]
MKKTFKKEKSKYILIILALVSLIIPAKLLAIGQVTEPIVVDNALRGQAIEKEMFLLNTEDMEVTFNLIAEGDITDWTTFYYPDDLTIPIENVSIFPKSRSTIIAKIEVPEDVANNTYQGFVSILNVPNIENGTEETSAVITQKVARQVSITVTDQEDVNVDVSIIPTTYDLSGRQPLEIRVIYYNQGNVIIRPDIQVKITQAGETKTNTFYSYPDDFAGVKPLSSLEIPSIEVPTSGLKTGKYTALVSILYKGQSIYEKSFDFSVLSSNKIIDINNPLVIGIIGIIIVLIIGTVLLIRKKLNRKIKEEDIEKNSQFK